jgi:hypothetical protein
MHILKIIRFDNLQGKKMAQSRKTDKNWQINLYAFQFIGNN